VREPRLANIALRAAIAPVAGWAAVVVRGRYGWVDWPLLLAVGAMMLLHLFVNAAANQLG
jgi:1,4-dihydroxy-2-naphthoate octaprenyltransferase